MKRRLIALRGPSSVGKSTTLSMLYRLLVAEPSNVTRSYKSVGRKLDFEAILEIHGCRVALISRGDVPAQLKRGIASSVRSKCDVIVCAARTRGIVSTILLSFDPPYQVVEVPKGPKRNATPLVSNLSAAHDLAARIYAAIDD